MTAARTFGPYYQLSLHKLSVFTIWVISLVCMMH